MAAFDFESLKFICVRFVGIVLYLRRMWIMTELEQLVKSVKTKCCDKGAHRAAVRYGFSKIIKLEQNHDFHNNTIGFAEKFILFRAFENLIAYCLINLRVYK